MKLTKKTVDGIITIRDESGLMVARFYDGRVSYLWWAEGARSRKVNLYDEDLGAYVLGPMSLLVEEGS